MLLVLVFVTPLAFSQEIKPFLGTWGSDTQCSGSLIIPEGTKRASPFDIGPDWLGYGNVFCRLNWIAVQSTVNGTMAIAKAICGEDMERDYQISFILSGDALTIVWNESFQNGPMMRCLSDGSMK